ncbi:hypothetical protein J6590_028255 [Homalodisca vitripennis]|nr:hypothetical protein J6590_028255 [Homalodisca vitripennis]
MDESTNLMKEIRSELALVKKENENLRNLNSALTAEVDSLKGRVRSLEQYSRKSNLEINGIPETPKENVSGLELRSRRPTYQQHTEYHLSIRIEFHPLIVQFSRRTVRDTLLNKFKDKKTMTAEQINAAFPAQKIYFSNTTTKLSDSQIDDDRATAFIFSSSHSIYISEVSVAEVWGVVRLQKLVVQK